MLNLKNLKSPNSILGWIITILIPAIIGVFEHMDFFITRAKDPGWIKIMFDYIIDYSFAWYILCLFVGFFLLYRVAKQPKSKKTSEKEELAELQTTPLEIRFTENQLKYVCVDGDTNNATYAWESVTYRVAIRNNSKTQTIKNVEARITSIKTSIEKRPYWLIGKLPIILNCNGNEHFDIHADIDVPVDIVMWKKDTRWEDGEVFAFCGNEKLQIPDGNFTISLTVSGEDIASVQKNFTISLNSQHEANLNKISMKPA